MNFQMILTYFIIAGFLLFALVKFIIPLFKKQPDEKRILDESADLKKIKKHLSKGGKNGKNGQTAI